MALRDNYENDLDLRGRRVFNPGAPSDPLDIIRKQDLDAALAGVGSSLTFTDGVTLASGIVHGDYITGKAGGNTWSGGLNSGDGLTIDASKHAVKGAMRFNASGWGFNVAPLAPSMIDIDLTQTFNQVAGTTLDAFRIRGSEITFSSDQNITTSDHVAYVFIGAPTFTSTDDTDIDVPAATVWIEGSPDINSWDDTNLAWSLYVKTGNAFFGGDVYANQHMILYGSGNQVITKVTAGDLSIFPNNGSGRTFLGTFSSIQLPYRAAAGINVLPAGSTSFQVHAPGSVVSATSAVLDAVHFDPSTTTISGSTAITTATGFNQVTFAIPTFNGTPNITHAANVVIAGEPAGTAPATNKSALWVQGGTTRLAGTVVIQALNGLLKATAGVVSPAIAGVDYDAGFIFSTGLTNLAGTVTANLSVGVGAGQSVIGGADTGGDLTLSSTSHATKGRVLNGAWFALDETNQRLLLGTQTAGVGAPLTIASSSGGIAIRLNQAAQQNIAKTGGSLVLATEDNQALYLSTSNTGRLVINGSGQKVFTNAANLALTTGNGAVFRYNQSVNAASAATLDNILFDTSTIDVVGVFPGITTATGFNNVVFRAPVINGSAGMSNAATVAIMGPPTGTMPITNKYALWVQNGATYLSSAIIGTWTGLLKATVGVVSVGIAGTDYEAALTFGSGVTRTANAVAADYITGKAGNQSWYGGFNSGDSLTIKASIHAQPGPMTLTESNLVVNLLPPSLTSTTSLTLDAVKFNPYTLTLVAGTSTVTTATGLNYMVLPQPVYTSTSPVTVSQAATLTIAGGPTYTGSAFITNRYAIWVQQQGIRIDGGDDIYGAAIWLNRNAQQNILKTGGSFVFATGDANDMYFSTNNVARFLVKAAGSVIFTNTPVLTLAAGNGIVYRYDAAVTSGASATLDAILYDTGTVTIAGTTPIATATGFNFVTFKAPVYNGAAAIAYGSTMTIAGPPTGTNPVTNPYSFWVQSGTTRLAGTLIVGILSGVLKGSSGTVGTAILGVDYEGPLVFSTGLTRVSNTVTANLSVGVSTGQSVIGGSASGESLRLSSTAHATKGRILCGSLIALDEVNNRLLLGTQTAGVGAPLTISSVDGGGNLIAIKLDRAGEQDVIKSGGLLVFGTSDAQSLYLSTGNIGRVIINGAGQKIFTNRSSAGSVTSGNGAVFRYTQTVTSATSATLDSILFDAGVVTLGAGSSTITTTGGFNYAAFKIPTINGPGSAVAITRAATVAIEGAPSAVEPVTIAKAHALWLQNGSLGISGADVYSRAIYLDQAYQQNIAKTGGTLVVATEDAQSLLLSTANTARVFINGTGGVGIQSDSDTIFGSSYSFATYQSGARDCVGFRVGGYPITDSSPTDRIFFNINSAVTTTVSNGVTANRYATVSIRATQYIMASGTATCDVVASLYITNAPTVGAGFTANNRYSIFCDAGLARFDGDGTNVFEVPYQLSNNSYEQFARIPVKVTGHPNETYFILLHQLIT